MARPAAAQVGGYMRSVLEPMARKLGVDQDASFFTPPSSEPEAAFYLYRIGLSLLMTYTYEDGWVNTDSRARNKRKAKRSGKLTRKALLGPRGSDAVSLMAEGYVYEMAQLWRRAARVDAVHRDQLLESARRAEDLSELVARCWPVDAQGAREQVARFEGMRHFDPDNPDARIDLHSYAGRARAVALAVVFLVGDDTEEAGAMLFRLMIFDMTFGSAALADWNFEGEHLANLLQGEPQAYGEIVQIQNERHA